MVAVVHVSNVLGTINPVAELARAGPRSRRADAGRRIAERAPDAGGLRLRLGCDFLAFTGHKMLGPTGIGVLVARPETLDAMEPFLGGGEMIRDVDHLEVDLERPAVEVRGGHAAHRRGHRPGRGRRIPLGPGHGPAVRAHEADADGYALGALGEVEGITIYGPRDVERRGGGRQLQPARDAPPRSGPAPGPRRRVRAGRPPLRQAAHAGAGRGGDGSRERSPVYNLREEIDALVRSLGRARAYFAG